MLKLRKPSAIYMRVFCVAAFFGTSDAVLATQQYTIQGIGNFTPEGINDSAQVAGAANGLSGNPDNVIIWTNTDTTQIFSNGAYEEVAPETINNSGEVVGSGYPTLLSSAPPQSFVWNPNQGFITENVPNGAVADLSALNNAGQVGGQVISSGVGQAAVWLSPQNPTLLPYFGEDTQSNVDAINNGGQAAGWSGYPQSATSIQEEAVFWQNGTVTDLTPGNTWSKADGINNQGQVIGNMNVQTAMNGLVSVPFVWDTANGLVDLPDAGDGGDVEAINDRGQMVGYVFEDNESISLGALWANGVLYNLTDLVPADSGWDIIEATSINNLGQIVGVGIDNGQVEAFLLTPDGTTTVPEPSAIPLAVGFCFLAGRRQRNET